MIQAAIFDMDGLLIDSEPFWQESIRTAFGKVGIILSREMCTETMGFRLDEVVMHWYLRFPWNTASLEQVEADILAQVIFLIENRGEAKPGVRQALDFVKAKQIKVGLASGSYYRIIDVAIKKLGIRSYFDVIYSAQDEKKGKPDPAIYLTTAMKLGVHPHQTVAFEDSRNGILSAKAAGMFCVAVPDLSMPVLQDVSAADLRIESLYEVNDRMWERMSHS